jgi:hypothetical protein
MRNKSLNLHPSMLAVAVVQRAMPVSSLITTLNCYCGKIILIRGFQPAAIVNATMHGRAVGRRRSLCSTNAAQQRHNVVFSPADGQSEGGLTRTAGK